MIYEFKCRATGNIIMTAPVGDAMLEAIGREPSAQGVITTEQMPEAIARLQALSAANPPTEPPDRSGGDFDGDRGDIPVSLSQRAFPLIEMLQQAHRAGKDVTWGA